ncbi:MAG: hypothetical protein AB8B96_05865 [Lysobacterales bacterium]
MNQNIPYSITPVPLTIGVTAHRDLCPEQTPQIRQAAANFLTSLRDQFPHTPLRLLCALAEGGDQLMGQLAIDLGLELAVPIPFSLAEYRRDFSTEGALRVFDQLITQASQVIELPRVGNYSISDLATNSDARDMQYANLGVYLSDRCQVLMALWDGKSLNYPGGTSQVVHYHQFGQMRGVKGHFDRPSILAEDDTDLVYHIVCSRRRDDGEPAEGLDPGTTRMLITDPERRQVDALPERYQQMIGRLGEYNRDGVDQDPLTLAKPDYLPGWSACLKEGTALDNIARHFFTSDAMASVYQRRYLTALRSLAVVGLAMTCAFIAYADLDQPLMIYGFLLGFGAGLSLAWLAGRNQWHRKYLDYRALAEGLRVQFYWGLAGVSGRHRNDFAHDNFLQKQDLEIGWIRNVMRHVGMAEELGDPSVNLEQTIDHWVGADEDSGQLGFFLSRWQRMAKAAQRTRHIVRGCVWLSICAAAALAALQFAMDERLVQALLVAIGLMSVGVAVRELYANKTAQAELSKQYAYMYRVFRDARLKLDSAESDQEKRDILQILGEAALDEHAEWIQRHRERPLEQGSI